MTATTHVETSALLQAELAEPVTEFDLSGLVLHADSNFLALMGYQLDEIKGRYHRMFVDTESVGAPATAVAARTMLTYDLDVEIAAPLAQISEILPYARAISIFAEGGPILGVMVNRGRSTPMLCLGQLHAGFACGRRPSASVLVVESEGELVGFVASGLKAIEPSLWQPQLQHAGRAGHRWQLALVGEGAHERMLPVLDLQQLAHVMRQSV